MGTICIKVADITTLKVDAIVNAANSRLYRGGGVCGAIFSAAGSHELEKECARYQGCPTGSAVITSGCRLKAKYIIHAVGPIWNGGKHLEAELLYSCYEKSLQLAMENNCHSIAFPVISSGIYGYPKMEAWRMGLMACICFFSANSNWDMHVTFAVLNDENHRIGIVVLENIWKQSMVDSVNLMDCLEIDDETYDGIPERMEKNVPAKEPYPVSRDRLVAVFKDTLAFCSSNPYIASETLKMQTGTRLFLSDYESSLRSEKSNGDNIEVIGISTYAAANQYKADGKVAVLNFANCASPGGGVTRGSLAQEECLCRSSNLYLGINVPYLKKHYYDYNDAHGAAMGSDSVIYSPGVTIFKNDAVLAEMLPENEWYQTDVITCAAPRFGDPSKIIEHKLKNLHIKRGKNILEVAISNNVDVIVLGAFGCGAFNNTPATVAEAYKELLVNQGYAKYFKKVVFAILHDRNDKFGNYEIFKNVLGDN